MVITRLAALVVWAAATGPLLAQDRPAQPADWIRKGDVATLAAALDKDPQLANRPDPQGVLPLFWAERLAEFLVERLGKAGTAQS